MTIKQEDFAQAMENIVYNKPFRVIADEAPQAYKNITEVITARKTSHKYRFTGNVQLHRLKFHPINLLL